MLCIYTSAQHLQVLEHFQVFNILQCEIAADVQTEGCWLDIQTSVSAWKDLVVC